MSQTDNRPSVEPGDDLFVVTASPGQEPRILFRTRAEATFQPDDRPPLLISVDGLKFTGIGDAWLLQDKPTPRRIALPATTQTVEQVRAAGRERRRRQYALKELKRQWQEQIDAAAKKLSQAQDAKNEPDREINRLREMVSAQQRRVAQLERDAAQARNRLNTANRKLFDAVATRTDRIRAATTVVSARRADLRRLRAQADHALREATASD